MLRRLSIILIAVVCITVPGCTVMRHFDGSSEEEKQKFTASKDELWSETKKLKQENESFLKTIAQRQAEIDQLNSQMANLKKDMDSLNTELQQTKEAKQREVEKSDKEVQPLKEQASAQKEQVTVIEEKKEETPVPEKEVAKEDAAQTTKVEKGIEPKMLKVKVLSGNGKISSAKALSVKLKELGYMVDNIGMAPRSNFTVNTVYYAPDYKNNAQNIAAQLGNGCIFMPLTWSSAFHIIVVTGP